MKATSIIGAVIGGLVGAIIWGAVGYFFSLEIGYIAWGIGLLVGFLSAAMGGSGTVNGVLCAGVAIASILAGKGLAVHFAIDKEFSEIKQSVYEEWKGDAEAFTAIADDESQYPVFIFEHGFTEAESPDEISEEEVDYFKTTTIPQLNKLSDGQSFDDWERQFEATSLLDTNAMVAEAVKEGVGVLDIVFALLGLVTAFKVGSGTAKDEVPASDA